MGAKCTKKLYARVELSFDAILVLVALPASSAVATPEPASFFFSVKEKYSLLYIVAAAWRRKEHSVE